MIRRHAAVWALLAACLILIVFDIAVRQDLYVLFGWAVFPIVGALILTNRPGNNIGRALLAVGLLWAGLAGSFVVVELIGTSGPTWLPYALSVVGNICGILAYYVLLTIALIFPSGSVTTTGGRVILAILIATAVATLVSCLLVAPPPAADLDGPWLLIAFGGVGAPDGMLLNFALPLLVAAEVLELSLRWRRSTPDQQLQYRWFVFGCSAVIVLLIGDALWQVLAPATHPSAEESAWLRIVPLNLLPMNAIPLSIGLAVFRYGLYDVRRVAGRVFAYAVVSAFSIAMYGLVVVSVTWLLPGAPALAVALATLAAAGLFLPALRRTQRIVDRHFDRERYVAERVAEGFGERLRTRVDASTVSEELVTTVDAALRPASVGLWTAGRTT